MQNAVQTLHHKLQTGAWDGECLALWQHLLRSIHTGYQQPPSRDAALLVLSVTDQLFSSETTNTHVSEQHGGVAFCGAFFSLVHPRDWLAFYLGSDDRFVSYSASNVLGKIFSACREEAEVFSGWLSALVCFWRESLAAASADADRIPGRCTFALSSLASLLQCCKQWKSAGITELLLGQVLDNTALFWPYARLQCEPFQTGLLQERLSFLFALLPLLWSPECKVDSAACRSPEEILAGVATPRSQSQELILRLLRWLEDVVPSLCSIVKRLSEGRCYSPCFTGSFQVLRSFVANVCTSSRTDLPQLCQLLCGIIDAVLAYCAWCVVELSSVNSDQCPFISSYNLSDRRQSFLVVLAGINKLIETGHSDVGHYLEQLVLSKEASTLLVAISSAGCAGCQLTAFLADDDEDLFEALHLLQLLSDYPAVTSLKRQTSPALMSLVVEPSHLFLHLLDTISADHLVFVDWLVSDETCCSQYFTAFLTQVCKSLGRHGDSTNVSSCAAAAAVSGASPSSQYAVQSTSSTTSTGSSHLTIDTSLTGANPFRTAMFAGPDAKSSVPTSPTVSALGQVLAGIALVSYSDSSSEDEGGDCKDEDMPGRASQDGMDNLFQSPSLLDFEVRCEACAVTINRDRVLGFMVRLRLLVERLNRRDLLPFPATELIALLTEVESWLEEDVADAT